MSNPQNEWWRDADFAYQGKSDGQQFLAAFSRDNDGTRETVVVLCSDGDGPGYVFGGVQIVGDVITEIGRDK